MKQNKPLQKGEEWTHSHQEGTEEDEGDKVKICKLASTLWLRVPREGITDLPSQTRQHDIMPCLSCCTPAYSHRYKFSYRTINRVIVTDMGCLKEVTHLKSRIRARKKVLKLLCWLMELSRSSSIAMFPNSYEVCNYILIFLS